MRIKLTVPRCGPTMLGIGDVIERPEHIARELIARGEAVPVAETKIERAVSVPVMETRTTGRRKK